MLPRERHRPRSHSEPATRRRSRNARLDYHRGVPPCDSAAPRSSGEIFRAFSRAALLGFGGMLPQLFHQLVTRKRWVSAAEFAEAQTIGQALPGPALANLAAALGYRWGGVRGALAALAGTIATPALLMILIGYLYRAYGDLEPVRIALHGMSAMAAGLLAGVGLRTAPLLGRRVHAWLIAAAFFVG